MPTPTLEQLLVFREGVQRRSLNTQRRAKRPDLPDALILQYTRTLDRLAVRVNTEIQGALDTEVLRMVSGEVAALSAGGMQSRRDILPPLLESRLRVLTQMLADIRTTFQRNDVAGVHFRKVEIANRRAMQRVLGIDPSSVLAGDIIQAFREGNVRLIRGLMAQGLVDVRQVMTRAQEQGMRVEEIRDELQRRFGITRSRAQLIARDQTLKMNAQVAQRRQEAAGVTEYIWDSSQDSRVRPDHAALHGTKQQWAVRPVTDRASGRRNHPGEDFQCRCVAVPVTDGLLD